MHHAETNDRLGRRDLGTNVQIRGDLGGRQRRLGDADGLLFVYIRSYVLPADVLSAALYTRFRSRQDHTFAEKILSAMRKQFGGHQEAPQG